MFPNFFADAEASFADAYFVIFGVLYEDEEMSFREGTSLAPSCIRYASWNFESYHMLNKIDLQDIPIHDYGDITINEIPALIEKIIEKKAIPIAIGGCHAITPLLVSSIKKKKECGVVLLDAHLDFREEYNNDKESHACTTHRLLDFMGTGNVVPLGIRSMSREEKEEAEKMGLPYVTSWEIKAGIDKVVDAIPFKKIYLSVDMDVFDPSYAPGVGNPEPLGLSDVEVFEIVRKVAPCVIGMDVVETSPRYDNGRTALLAAKIIRDYISWANAR